MSAEPPRTTRRPRWRVYLDLGRVSNLPTVWTNCVAGAALSGAALETPVLLLLAAALSCFYTGGMFLNDAFDHRHDARTRPRRPIPSGEAGLVEVYALGFGFLALGQSGLYAVSVLQAGPRLESLGMGVILGVLIVYYNYRHKTDPHSPVVMSVCRGLIYLIAASVAAGFPSGQVWIGALVLACYVAGLTGLAAQEDLNRVNALWPALLLLAPMAFGLYAALWDPPQPALLPLMACFLFWTLWSGSFLTARRRNVPRAVAGLIAGISLVDGVLIAAVSPVPGGPLLALAGLLLTRLLQRFVPGT